MNEVTDEKEFFDRIAEDTGRSWWGSSTPAGIWRFQKRARMIAKSLSDFRNPLVLELGCGTGLISRFLLEEKSSIRLFCSDISPKSIRVAANRCAKYKNVHFEVMDATSLCYSEKTFDAVFGVSILHHIPIGPAVKECFRVLKPGGIIWFSEPNMMNPEIAVEKNVPIIGSLLQNTKGETAFFRWSLERLLDRVGFVDIRVKPFDFLHPLVPYPLINMAENAGRLIEKIPLIKEFSGSLSIHARKPL